MYTLSKGYIHHIRIWTYLLKILEKARASLHGCMFIQLGDFILIYWTWTDGKNHWEKLKFNMVRQCRVNRAKISNKSSLSLGTLAPHVALITCGPPSLIWRMHPAPCFYVWRSIAWSYIGVYRNKHSCLVRLRLPLYVGPDKNKNEISGIICWTIRLLEPIWLLRQRLCATRLSYHSCMALSFQIVK